MSRSLSNSHMAVLLLAGLTLAWAVLSWTSLGQQSHAGFDTNGNHTVLHVDAGSPAQRAGLQAGDVLNYFDGIAVQDSAAMARMPRKKAGDVLLLNLSRDGLMQDIAIHYLAAPPQQVHRAQAAIVVGWCFFLFPMLAWFRHPCMASRILLLAGFGLCLAFLQGPYLVDFSARSLVKAGSSLFVMLGVAAVMHFLLVFPHPRSWLGGALGKRLIYLPALLLWALIAYRVIFTPVASGGLNSLTNLLAGLVMGAYILVSLFLILRNYSRTDAQERNALAVNGMLLGAIVGVLPVTIAQLVSAFSPQSQLPGQGYYFVSLVLIPIFWSRSVMRSRPR